MAKECKLRLKSSDNQMFEVEQAVALESQTIKNMIEDIDGESTDILVPLPNVPSKILAMIIEYCKYHVEAAKSNEENSAIGEDAAKAWDQEFVKVDMSTLFDLILAANYLNIKNLLDLTLQTVAEMIKGKTAEEIRKTFNIKNDFTPEEEKEVRCNILDRVPNSALWLFRFPAAGESNLQAFAVSQGVRPEQIIFADVAVKKEHISQAHWLICALILTVVQCTYHWH